MIRARTLRNNLSFEGLIRKVNRLGANSDKSTGESCALTVAERSPAELSTHRRSLKALTGIRFFAAFYVVIFHTRLSQNLVQSGHVTFGHFFGNGYLAVPMFFLLSGLILAYTYAGQIGKPGDHRRFWEARFSRIWPVYAVSLLMASIPNWHLPSFPVALATLCMVQAWNPFDLGMAGAWNMVCWTLSVEAVFYLCFPWVQTWVEKRSERTHLLLIVVLLILCIWWNSTSYVLGSKPNDIVRWVPLPIPHLPEFFSGVLIGNYFLRKLATVRTRPGTRVLVGSGVWTYSWAVLSITLLSRAESRWSSLIVTAFAALLYGLAAEQTFLSRLLSTKIMLLAGEISYSVYLIQIPIKFWIQDIGQHVALGGETSRFLITTVTLIVVSLVLFKTVEGPARKILRGVFARMEVKRETARQDAKL